MVIAQLEILKSLLLFSADSAPTSQREITQSGNIIHEVFVNKIKIVFYCYQTFSFKGSLLK